MENTPGELSMQIRCKCSKPLRAFLLCCPALGLAGCAAIPLKRLQPVADPPSLKCTSLEKPQMLVGEPSDFAYELVSLGQSTTFIKQDNSKGAPAAFEGYRKLVLAEVRGKLPNNLKNHKVTLKITDFFAAVSGQSQVNAATAEGALTADRVTVEQKAIDKHIKAPNITHREMKDFASKLFDSQLRPGAASVIGGGADPSGLSDGQKRLLLTRVVSDKSGATKTNYFIGYFEAFYKGTFVDRMGTKVSPPTLSATITDAEITNAEIVLLEFLIDAIDPTPVFGDTDLTGKTTIPTGITFYPGGAGTTAPTVLTKTFATNPKIYAYLPTPPTQPAPPAPPISNTLCGITTDNVWVLRDLASGSGDEAGAVGGLVANTVGGVSLGLGAAGNISIGDNQTLSVLVKTAASRIAMRATLASSYRILRNVKFNVTEP
jgi:hypothetical protein